MIPANQSMGGFLTLLRNTNFLRLWLAQVISMTMLSASNFALISLLGNGAGKDDSAIRIGLVIVFSCLPAVLLGGVTGVFVDRRNKQRVLFFSNCLRAIATCGFVVTFLINQNQLILIYFLTFLISSIGQFFIPAEGATIPMLVSKGELMTALSLFQVTSLLTTPLGLLFLAPLLIALLPSFSVMGLAVTPFVLLYLLMAICYVVCAILITRIPAERFLETERRTERVTPSGLFAELSGALYNVWQETTQAWTFVRRRSMLLKAVIQLSFAGVLLLLISELAYPLVRDLLLLSSPNAMVLIFGPAGAALVVSSLFLSPLTARLGKSRTILIGCLSLAFLITLLPLSTTLAHALESNRLQVGLLHVIVVMIVMFLAGIAINCINTPANTAMQEQTPGWVKGRVLALQLVLYNGSAIPILLLVSVLARLLTLSVVLYILAVAIAAFGLWGPYYERRSLARKREPGTEEQDQEEEAPIALINSRATSEIDPTRR